MDSFWMSIESAWIAPWNVPETERKGGIGCEGRCASTLTVVRQSPAVLELLSSEDESLLVGRDALLVLNLGLDVVDRVRGLDLERDRLSSEAEVSGERGDRVANGCRRGYERMWMMVLTS